MARIDIRPSKRRKVEQEKERPTPDIRGAFELHDLLRFKQSTSPDIKAGVDKFKDFLTSIQKNEDPSEKEIQLKVLKQYCDDQSSSTKNDIDFPDLLSTWSFAAQSDAESILSAVPAALAQFFRTISSELDFREFGSSLCHSLLKQDQLRLIDGGLSAPKFKEFLISPCLRLLTEIVSFDAGALSGNVFSRRDIILRRLDSLLDTFSPQQENPDRRRPTVRRNAQRLLLALLRYLDSDSKVELVSQGKVLNACLRRLPLDGGDVVRDLLDSFKRHLIEADLPRQAKSRFLHSGNLTQLAALYDFEPEDVELDDKTKQSPSVREAAHKLLLQVCTTRNGILLQQSAWYPSGFDFEASAKGDEDGINLGLDSPYYFDEYTTTVPVKNTILSSFLQSLRPHRDTLQSGLIIAIFQTTPELVADYFTKKPRLAATSKDEASWRGQFAFIFSVVNLPIPVNCGWHDGMSIVPPPLSIVLESILPRPMDRSTVTQCLKSSDEVTVMSAARLMTKALTKLDGVRKMFSTASSSPDMWDQACMRLSELVASRAPTYHDFVTALQSSTKNQILVRQALLECMAMYYKVLPMSTAGSKFDVGPLLMEVIDQLLAVDIDDSDQEEDLSLHVISLCEIASRSSTVRWWYKPKPDQLSPLLSLIKAYVTTQFLTQDRTILRVIYDVLHRSGIVLPGDAAADALISSLRGDDGGKAKNETSLQVFLFAENCMIRTSKQPVKYLDILEAAQRETSDSSPLSLLPVCVTEQWPHILRTSDSGTIKDLSLWLARLFSTLISIGENKAVLEQAFRKQILGQSTKEARKVLHKAFIFEDGHTEDSARTSKGPYSKKASHDPTKSVPTTEGLATGNISTTPHVSTTPLDLTSLFPPPSHPPSSLKGLIIWSNSEFEAELTPPIATSRIARLIHGFSSSLEEVRLQAQQTFQTIMHTLSTSTYAEKDQVYLLFGEICETARQHSLTASTPSQSRLTNGPTSQKQQREKDPALPSVVASLATLLLSILTNPADKMYSKTNGFLLLAPTWTPITRLLPYWIDLVLLRDPEVDEPYAWEGEVTRLLDVLVGGLRTEQDLDVYRRAGVFERLGSLYVSPALGPKGAMRKKILHVFANAMEVDGGADTLITRVGVRAWFEIVLAREGEKSEIGRIVEALKARVEEKCSRAYIERWEEERPVFREGSGMKRLSA